MTLQGWERCRNGRMAESMKTKSTVCVAVLVVLSLSGLLLARPLSPEFEVASIKPTKFPGGVTGGCHGSDGHFETNEVMSAVPLGRCVITAGRLSHIMAIAYQIDVNRIDGRLTWESDESPASVVQEQLGLRMEAQKVPVEFITIDSAEKPTEN
jgi:hypothetical protein